MLNYIARTGVAHAHLLKDAADELYKTLVKLAFAAMAGVLVMWALNAGGAKEVNFAFFFLGVIVFAIWIFAPTRLLIAAGAGAAVQGLKDEDLTQGAIKGIVTLYKVALGVMLWFMIVAGILSVISFQAKPLVFFPVVAMLLLITVAYASVKNGTVKALIAIFGTAVIVFYMFALVPDDWKFWKSEGRTNQTQPGKVVAPAAPASLQLNGEVAWDKLEADGSVPVGVWSQKLAGRPFCSVSLAHDTSFKRQFQNNSTAWVDYVPGTSPDFTAWRFQATEPGKTPPVFQFKCS